jgi:prepilin-type N-terminal cleavage/methylation domain-containing protein
MKKGFTLIELLIVVAIIAILAAIAVPNFLEAQVRSKVSRVKTDIRSLATGIESYYIDNNLYPVCAREGRLTAGEHHYNYYQNTWRVDATHDYCTFSAQQNANPKIFVLTTPIAYITSYFVDPFADCKSSTFGYYCDTNGWIAWSPGPDTDQAEGTDLSHTTRAVETVYDSRISQPSLQLLVGYNTATGTEAFTYDPTNGTVSPGDVWRVKQ